MPAVASERQYDLVLFGATGFTGGLTADYLAANAPDGLRWALAGRNRGEARGGRARASPTPPRARRRRTCSTPTPPTAAALATVAESRPGRHHHGRPLRAATASRWSPPAPRPAPTTSTSPASPSSSTGCTSTTTPTAERTGARIVHCCGFDSIPHDLGAYFTVQQLPEGVPLTVDGYVRADASFSGGTFHSAINGFARGAPDASAPRKERRAAEPRAGGPRGPRGRRRRAPPRRRARRLGGAAADDRPADRPPLRRRRSSATAPTSPTATTWSPSTWRRSRRWRPGSARSPCWRSCRRPASCC